MPKENRTSESEWGAPPPRNTGTIITGQHVSEQAVANRAKAALDTLRPSEPLLGTLTSEEETWLATAFAQLKQIYDKREAGKPGDNALCIFEVGDVYVQFLAPWDAELLVCEAVSAKFAPEVVAILTEGGDETLRKLGFEVPEISPNYSQTIKIEGVADLAYAARLALRVLKQAYRVTDFGSAEFKIKIPSTLKATVSMSVDDNVAPHPRHGPVIEAMIERELDDSPEAEVDPTYRISKLAAANNPPIYVSPDSDKREAVTLMLTNDFSQLPVMTSDREVKGVISWISIGTRLALGKDGSSVRDLMDSHYEIRAHTSIFGAIPTIAMHQYVLVRGVDNRISGIVTATDLSLQFQQLTEPFLRLGEIENHIRLILGDKFSVKELASVRDVSVGSKEINSVADLTYGDYIRLLENDDRFDKIKIRIDRKTFCGQLDKVRRIRNDVMHFDLDGIPSSDLGLLRDFARFLRRLRKIGVQK